jgi:hypothetical protein
VEQRGHEFRAFHAMVLADIREDAGERSDLEWPMRRDRDRVGRRIALQADVAALLPDDAITQALRALIRASASMSRGNFTQRALHP